MFIRLLNLVCKQITAMASSVSVCKVGLHWDSPKAPRVYSQPKLATKGYQKEKRAARNFNQQYNNDTASASIKALSSSSSSSLATCHISSLFQSSDTCNVRKTLRCLDESMQTRLQGRSSAMIPKLRVARY